MSSGERTCSHCGASMRDDQDWCLQCGQGARGGATSGPGWRSAAAAIGATCLLALGAAAAAYAALQSHPQRKPAVVAQKPTTPPVSTPPPSTPSTATPLPSTPSPGTPETLKATTNLPQIPSTTSTPPSKRTPAKRETKQVAKKGQQSKSEGSKQKAGEEGPSNQPVPLLLDPNAAAVYNPSAYPATRFGDPSLAIDGETTTAWTIQLEPAQAPGVDVGLSLDLNAPISVSKLTLITETPGITVQIYGTSAAKLPETLESEEWVRLSRPHLVKKRKATIELQEARKRFRHLLIWILKAPVSEGTGQFTQTEAKVNEVQLYEAKR